MKNFLKPTLKIILLFVLIPPAELGLIYILDVFSFLPIPFFGFIFSPLADLARILVGIQIGWLYSILNVMGLPVTVHVADYMSWDPPSPLGWVALFFGTLVSIFLYYVLACYIVKREHIKD